MTLKIVDPTLSQHRNKFIVQAKGYFGDMDETFHGEIPFDSADDAEALHKAFEAQERWECETREALVAAGHRESVVDQIPIDSGGILPCSIESLRILYADVNGQLFNVEVF